MKAVQLPSRSTLHWSATVPSFNESMIVHEDVGSKCKQLVWKFMEQYKLLQIFDRDFQ